MIASAISSGDCAPISKPIGACRRDNCDSLMPSFNNLSLRFALCGFASQCTDIKRRAVQRDLQRRIIQFWIMCEHDNGCRARHLDLFKRIVRPGLNELIHIREAFLVSPCLAWINHNGSIAQTSLPMKSMQMAMWTPPTIIRVGEGRIASRKISTSSFKTTRREMPSAKVSFASFKTISSHSLPSVPVIWPSSSNNSSRPKISSGPRMTVTDNSLFFILNNRT